MTTRGLVLALTYGVFCAIFHVLFGGTAPIAVGIAAAFGYGTAWYTRGRA